MNQGTKTILWSAVLLLTFSVLPLGEIWLLKQMGFDVLAHLKLTLSHGSSQKIAFEGAGAAAFVIAQPLILLAAFTRLSGHIGKLLAQSVAQVSNDLIKRVLPL